MHFFKSGMLLSSRRSLMTVQAIPARSLMIFTAPHKLTGVRLNGNNGLHYVGQDGTEAK